MIRQAIGRAAKINDERTLSNDDRKRVGEALVFVRRTERRALSIGQCDMRSKNGFLHILSISNNLDSLINTFCDSVIE